MVVPRSKKDPDSRKAFRFSRDGIAELRECFGDSSDALIPELEVLMREHLSPRAKRMREGWFGRSSHKTPVRIPPIVSALRRVVNLIDDMPPRVPGPSGTLGSLFFGQTNVTDNDRCRVCRQAAVDLLREIEPIYLGVKVSRRGRPVDIHRRWLSHDVAVLMRLRGVHVPASRSGTLAKVLQTVLVEAYGNAPVDLFRVVQDAARQVRGGTLDELRESVRRASKYSSDPAFWLNVASVH